MKKNILSSLFVCLLLLAGCSKDDKVTLPTLDEAYLLTEAQLNLPLSKAKSNISSAGYSYQGVAENTQPFAESAVYRLDDGSSATFVTLVALNDTVRYVALDGLGKAYFGYENYKGLFAKIGEQHTLATGTVGFTYMIYGSPTQLKPYDTIADYNQAYDRIAAAWNEDLVFSFWGTEANGIVLGTDFMQYSATVFLNTISVYFGDLNIAPGDDE